MPPKPAPASGFANSVGVNMHLTYYDTSYARFPEWRARLRELGVRHVRDGLIAADPRYIQRLQTLGRDGLRASVILNDRDGPPARLIESIVGPLKQPVAAVEAPDEPDLAGGTAWLGPLRSLLPEIKSAVKSPAGRSPSWGRA